MNKYDFKGLKRVNKKEARKIYNNGEKIMFIPCKGTPLNNVWCLGVWTQKDSNKYDFDKLVNAFEFYNCNSNQLGKYTAFYIKTN